MIYGNQKPVNGSAVNPLKQCDILENLDEVIFSVDLIAGKVKYITEACENLYGYSREDFYGDVDLWRKLIIPDDFGILQAHLAAIHAGVKDTQQYRIRHRDGSIRWVENKVIPITNSCHEVVAVEGITMDITHQKNTNTLLEKKVLERTKELRDTIKELESFSYTVSHDLMAPLRVMNGFAQILSEDYVGELDEQAKRCVEVIMSNSMRMGQLINDLLNFSRLGRKPIIHKHIVMNELVAAVREEQKAQNAECLKAEIVQHCLDNAEGDPAMLKQVWVNLLSNAIKYSSKKEQPSVEIGMQTIDGKRAYYIKDNGAGFNMAHAEKLFGVFSRLHNQKDFAGTGVGLALVSRIIAKHGGKVWAEAEEGKGAIFYFTLEEIN